MGTDLFCTEHSMPALALALAGPTASDMSNVSLCCVRAAPNGRLVSTDRETCLCGMTAGRWREARCTRNQALNVSYGRDALYQRNTGKESPHQQDPSIALTHPPRRPWDTRIPAHAWMARALSPSCSGHGRQGPLPQ